MNQVLLYFYFLPVQSPNNTSNLLYHLHFTSRDVNWVWEAGRKQVITVVVVVVVVEVVVVGVTEINSAQ